jgi:hypothetical protein
MPLLEMIDHLNEQIGYYDQMNCRLLLPRVPLRKMRV